MYQSALNRARSDKFILVLNLPPMMKQGYNSVLGENYKIDTLQFSIYGSPVPSVSVPSIDLPYSGQVYRGSSLSRPAYEPLSVKFLIDNGYKNYFILWKWLNLFNDSKKSTTTLTNAIDVDFSKNDPSLVNPMSKYTSNFSIYGLDEFNNKVISFDYNHAFPTNLSEINFSNQDPSEITSSVTFVFNQLNVNLLTNVDQNNC